MAYQPKSYRKFVATAATATLVATAFAPFASASFKDVETGSLYKEATDFLKTKGVNGYTDGTFQPTKTITRVEAAEITAKVLGLDLNEAPDAGFTDLPDRESAVKAVNALAKAGITLGYPDKTFKPNQNITRGELALWVQRGFDELKSDGEVSTFPDVFGHYTEAVDILVDNKVTLGYENGKFGTHDNATRGQYALFMQRADAAVNKEVEAEIVVETAQATDASTVVLTVKNAVTKEAFEGATIQGEGTRNIGGITVSEDGKTVTLSKVDPAFEDGKEYLVQLGGKDLENSGFKYEAKAEAAELKVEAVSAITETAVEINITPLTEDNEALEVEVIDGKGNVVATKPVAVSAGDKTITVEFVTAVKTADLVGVWSVNGVELNLDLVNQLADIIDAITTGDLALYNALEAAKIADVKDESINVYRTKLQEAKELKSLADVQAVINKVNDSNVSADEAATIVKAIFNAKGNEVTFVKAISSNLERVNPEWITDYTTDVNSVFSGEEIIISSQITAANAVDLLEELQAAIDTVNANKIGKAWADVESLIDTKDFAKVRTLINTYKVAPEEGEVDAYGYMLDVLEYQTALAAVNNASTNSAFTNAVTKVDALLKEFTKKYEGKTIYTGITGFKDGADNFDLTKVSTNATFVAAYRTAVKAADAGDKNQAKDILAIVNTKNTELNSTAITTALTNLNGVTATTTSAKVVEYLTAVQAFDTTLTAATKVEIKSAYADLYKDAVLTFIATPDVFEVTDVNDLVRTVNATADATALLKALNDATTATEVSTALINLNSETFINIHGDDKLTIATAVLAARAEVTGEKFTSGTDTTAGTFQKAVKDAVTKRTAALVAANALDADSTITEAQAVLALVAPTAYAALTPTQKVNAGQKLVDSLEFDKDGKLVPFKTLKAVLTKAGL